MKHSETDDEGVDDDFEHTSDPEGDEEEEDILEGIDVIPDDASEGEDDSPSDDSDEDDDDDDDDEDDEDDEDSDHGESAPHPGQKQIRSDVHSPRRPPSTSQSLESKAPSPVPQKRNRSLSPAQSRKTAILFPPGRGRHNPRSYVVEAICALPHPVPTHALASSMCMTHLLTGSDDGYIRDYDIFSAVNGKNFLTAPQRHHCGVVEGIMKSGQIRFWWENLDVARLNSAGGVVDEIPLSPVYSLAMQSDALWTLAGSDVGNINLFTTRHEPGRLRHAMSGHRGPVSALALEHDEKGFFSAGWDGEALQWDLEEGQVVRHFTTHGAQLAGICVKPLASSFTGTIAPPLDNVGSEPYRYSQNQDFLSDSSTMKGSSTLEEDAKSDTSYDPLFDDEPDADGDPDSNLGNAVEQLNGVGTQAVNSTSNLAMPGAVQASRMPSQATGRAGLGSIAPPKNAPPLLDSANYSTFSCDIVMTASIDGQVILWDKRVNSPGRGVGRLWMNDKTPPWCLSACWSADGGQIYAGRRNGTIDVWDVRLLGHSGPKGTPRLLKTLRNPLSSGVVSCVVAFPDGKHIACASIDNLRLWNVAEAVEPDSFGKKSGVQFKIIPGHHGGYISQMLVDPAARFLVSSSSNRGWHGESTRTVFVHDIKSVD